MTETVTANMNTATTIPTVDMDGQRMSLRHNGTASQSEGPMNTKEKTLMAMNTLGPIALETPLALKAHLI